MNSIKYRRVDHNIILFAYDSSLPATFINSGRNYSYFMQNVSSIFSKDDYTLVNFEYKVLPVMVSSRSDRNDYIPTLATGENKTDILKTLNELSPTLNGNISDEFFHLK